MKLDPAMLEALNQQVNRERQNSVPYLAMANRAAFMALPGLAKFLYKSSSEELEHAQRLTEYIIDRNDEVSLTPLQGYAAPAAQMINVGGVFMAEALALEEQNTERIKVLRRMAKEAGDEQTETALIWFVDEQTRSVGELIDLVQRWQFAEGCAAAVLALDHELGED